VGFVHHKQPRLQLREYALERRRGESFRRHVEQSRETSLQFGENLALLLVALRAIHEQHGNIQMLQLSHLIGHQRDQRRDDDGQTLQHQGRKLKAQALACACGHDADDVVAGHDVLDNLPLVRAKLRELEDPLQDVVNAVHEINFKIYCIADVPRRQ
jgi:hypothetical protein